MGASELPRKLVPAAVITGTADRLVSGKAFVLHTSSYNTQPREKMSDFALKLGLLASRHSCTVTCLDQLL